MTIEQTTGTRAQVWHGTAKKTSGGLTKSALMMNKHGRIVSRKMHNTAKKDNRLVKAGFLTKKGHFGFIKKGSRKHRSRKMRGGGDDEDMSEDDEMSEMEGGRRGRRRKMRGGVGNSTGSTGSQMVHATVLGNASNSTGSQIAHPVAVGTHTTGTRFNQSTSSGGGRRRRRGSRRMRGGMAYGGPFSPSTYDGKGVETSGVNLQFVAGSH
jgi:hypothetical protein